MPRQGAFFSSFCVPLLLTYQYLLTTWWMRREWKERKGRESPHFYQAFIALVTFFQVACSSQEVRFSFSFSASIFTILFLYQKQSKCNALSINSDLACVGSQRALAALCPGPGDGWMVLKPRRGQAHVNLCILFIKKKDALYMFWGPTAATPGG